MNKDNIKNDNIENDDVENDNVILIDENGEEVEFECLDFLEMNEKNYIVLTEIFDDEEEIDEDEEGEIVILEMLEENGENVFVTIEDEEELTAVFAEFKARVEDEMNIDEN